LHKKASAKVKEVQEYVADASTSMTKKIDRTTRLLEEAFGVASNEAKLFDREIVRHLRRAIKLSKELDRPKGWTDNYDKAAKSVASWDPKAESDEELKQTIKYLEAGKKHIDTTWAAYRKEELECNGMVDKALEDLYALDDARLKEAVAPYLTEYAGFFHKPT
jgi:hypothetical protein